jgi:hypothetical protein
MTNPFKIPYKEIEKTRGKIVSIFVFGLFIFLFLYLFKPFGITQLNPKQQFFITLGFGFVTTFMLFIFKYLIEPVVTKNNWTLGKSIIWDLVIASGIGIANYVYIALLNHQILEFKYLVFSVWTAILVGSIPVTISHIITLNRLYKAALIEASVPTEGILENNEVLIRAGNQKNELRLNPKNIVYLCSNDNYVTIVTMKGDIQNKTTIRGTLKSAESELRKNSRFVRCHKCYIVNLDFVEGLSGNNQNMIIRLKTFGTEIPVSRSKADIVHKKIK